MTGTEVVNVTELTEILLNCIFLTVVLGVAIAAVMFYRQVRND